METMKMFGQEGRFEVLFREQVEKLGRLREEEGS
jgi:hypothetical protein